MNRRQYLAATAATLSTVAVAGCSGADDGEDGGGNETTTLAELDDTETTVGTETDGGTGTETPEEFEPTQMEGEVNRDHTRHVEVTEHWMFETKDSVGVTGIVRNAGMQELSSVEVRVELNDGETTLGEFTDSSTDEIDSLESNKKWRFWVPFEEGQDGDFSMDEDLTEETSYTIHVDATVAGKGTTTEGGETTTEG